MGSSRTEMMKTTREMNDSFLKVLKERFVGESNDETLELGKSRMTTSNTNTTETEWKDRLSIFKIDGLHNPTNSNIKSVNVSSNNSNSTNSLMESHQSHWSLLNTADWNHVPSNISLDAPGQDSSLFHGMKVHMNLCAY